MTTYSEKLRDPRWQRKRLEILQRDDFTCRLCGDKESTLHVHHLYYDKGALPWDYGESALVTACEVCHQELHEVKYGERIAQCLIIGGAGMSELSQLLERLTIIFDDGPDDHRARLDIVEWNDFLFAIEEIIHGLSKKRTPDEIGRRVAYAMASARRALTGRD